MRSPKSGYAYAGAPDEQQRHFRDGWLYIGDLATWDADEYVTIVGRKDDMIISGGENVHPVQVEAVLVEHDGIADAAVVGVPDEQWGELVAAYKRPRAYRFVENLPLTATGKKIHYKLREQAATDATAGLREKP